MVIRLRKARTPIFDIYKAMMKVMTPAIEACETVSVCDQNVAAQLRPTLLSSGSLSLRPISIGGFPSP